VAFTGVTPHPRLTPSPVACVILTLINVLAGIEIRPRITRVGVVCPITSVWTTQKPAVVRTPTIVFVGITSLIIVAGHLKTSIAFATITAVLPAGPRVLALTLPTLSVTTRPLGFRARARRTNVNIEAGDLLAVEEAVLPNACVSAIVVFWHNRIAAAYFRIISFSIARAWSMSGGIMLWASAITPPVWRPSRINTLCEPVGGKPWRVSFSNSNPSTRNPIRTSIKKLIFLKIVTVIIVRLTSPILV